MSLAPDKSPFRLRQANHAEHHASACFLLQLHFISFAPGRSAEYLYSELIDMCLKVAAEAMALTEACLKSMSSWAQLLLDSYCWHAFWAHANPPGQENTRSTF